MRSKEFVIASSTTALLLGGFTVACTNQHPKPITRHHSDFSGGCDKYRVYAQNRWQPYGTAIRPTPEVLAKENGSFAPNEVIAVNGWIEAKEPAYPTNSPPWNNKIWFHLANQDGWVTFAGVRGAPTAPDSTGRANGGQPAATPATCEGVYQP